MQELWLLRSSRRAPVNVEPGRRELGTGLHMHSFPELRGAGREQGEGP